MEITIKELTFKLKLTFKAMMMYENILEKSFAPKGVTEIITYFYCVVLSSKQDIELTYDEFIEWLDNNPNTLTDFSDWILKLNKQLELITKK